jgi:hypothetical protein
MAQIMAHHLAHRHQNAHDHIVRWLELWTPWLSAVEAEGMVAAVLHMPLRWRADKLALRLQLTEAERSRLGITTIGAIDMTKAERAARRRKRNSITRQRNRRAKGAKPRPEYEATSISRAKPWDAHGISRATWYRRSKSAQ